jgi:hypothetical protein
MKNRLLIFFFIASVLIYEVKAAFDYRRSQVAATSATQASCTVQ